MPECLGSVGIPGHEPDLSAARKHAHAIDESHDRNADPAPDRPCLRGGEQFPCHGVGEILLGCKYARQGYIPKADGKQRPTMCWRTQIPVCLWFLAHDKTNGRFRDRRGETLFIDARKLGRMKDRVHRTLDPSCLASMACGWAQ